MSEEAIVAFDVVVRGRVQGVFFRATCAREAEWLGLGGWVRNRPDGAVAAHFEGPAEAVATIIDWCHHGPAQAVVSEVEATSSTPTGVVGFRVG